MIQNLLLERWHNLHFKSLPQILCRKIQLKKKVVKEVNVFLIMNFAGEMWSPSALKEYKQEPEIKENSPANEKSGNYYKDIKQCKSLKLIATRKQKLVVLL